MTKMISLIFLSLIFGMILPLRVIAIENEWTLQWDEQNKLEEKVSISGQNQYQNHTEWQAKETDNGLVFYREVNSWRAYNILQDRLPIRAEIKDFLIYQIITLKYDSFNSSEKTLYSSVIGNSNGILRISVPGFIYYSGVGNLEDYNKASWHLPIKTRPGNIILRVVTFNALAVALLIVFIGTIGILAIYVKYLIRTQKIIQEEYLTNCIVQEDEDNNE